MEKLLNELLKIAKNGTQREFLEFLPKLEVKYKNYIPPKPDEYQYMILSVYDDLIFYEIDLIHDSERIFLKDLISNYYLNNEKQQKGLLIVDAPNDKHLDWKDFSVSVDDFLIEN